ncbi:WYL domain-containing protein [Aquiluna borgnonia]|jgi:proteasome accessory factor B|uniref:WYL domain-containing protein n=1 Tax=Aquiluna borgnonia TaxID=2499157 RepID=A0A7D4PQP7_9MICO|nr:WYL domain-containing protein [Aquiluna borgnonia]QKJ25346.1 WYL domain-containing protein [Aquiluna borgnonia]
MAKQSPAERLFTLTCCLVASPRIGLSKQDIYRAVAGYQAATSDEARDRMFERDKQVLREAGVRLEVLENDSFDETDQSRYRIAKSSFEWPKGLELSSKKLQLLELAAKAWNSQLLEAPAQQGLTRLKSLGLMPAESDLRPFSPRLLARHASFAPLAAAISNSVQVVFEYQKPDGELSTRKVSPLKLRQLEGQWVLLGLHNSQIKNFLLRRISSSVTTLPVAAEKVDQVALGQAEQDLKDFVSGNLAVIEVVPDTEAAVIFKPNDEGLVTTTFMDEALFAEDLMEFGSQLRVISPESLQRRIKNGLKAVVRAHA